MTEDISKDWTVVFRRLDGSTRKVTIKDATFKEADKISEELLLVGEYIVDIE